MNEAYSTKGKLQAHNSSYEIDRSIVYVYIIYIPIHIHNIQRDVHDTEKVIKNKSNITPDLTYMDNQPINTE